jgi:hypothetical protein
MLHLHDSCHNIQMSDTRENHYHKNKFPPTPPLTDSLNLSQTYPISHRIQRLQTSSLNLSQTHPTIAGSTNLIQPLPTFTNFLAYTSQDKKLIHREKWTDEWTSHWRDGLKVTQQQQHNIVGQQYIAINIVNVWNGQSFTWISWAAIEAKSIVVFHLIFFWLSYI